jgi:hypothetical protein
LLNIDVWGSASTDQKEVETIEEMRKSSAIQMKELEDSVKQLAEEVEIKLTLNRDKDLEKLMSYLKALVPCLESISKHLSAKHATKPIDKEDDDEKSHFVEGFREPDSSQIGHLLPLSCGHNGCMS